MPIKEKFYIREGLVVNGDTSISGSLTTTGSYLGWFNSKMSSNLTNGLDGDLGYAALYNFDGYGGPVPNSPDNSWNESVISVGFYGRGLQIAGGYDTSNVYFRKGNTTWQSWSRILNASVDSYAAGMNQNVTTTSQVTFTGVTGSLNGTASYATNALTASYALSSAGGGSGTVNSGNANKLAYYASTGTAVSETSLLEYDGSNLKLTSTSQLDFYTNAGSIYFGNFSSPSYGRVGFSVPGQAVMVVDYSTARAGFGGGINLITGAPGGLVEIQGKADEIQLLVKGHSTQNNNVFEIKDYNGSQILTLDNSGVFNTAGGGTSDRRKKDNIMYLSYNYSNTINALKPAKFEFKNNPGVTRHGFIAQDVLEVKPELVLGNGQEENGTYGLDYDGILAITVKSLQEALARITQLEQIVEKLKK